MSRTLLLAGCMAVFATACSSPKLEIREVGTASRKNDPGTVSGRVAMGMSQLAMGNVGLALETFRRAVREEPTSHAALLGLAECYLQMGKPAIARRSLEQALALRPDVPELYRALAAAAEGEGKTAEAASLRREAELRKAQRSAVVSAPQAMAAAVPTPLPIAPKPVQAAPPAIATVAPTPVRAVPAPAPPAPSNGVTVDLALAPLRDRGPRLVRLSLGEVALMTEPNSPFAGIRQAAGNGVHPPLRILNAARVQGIAARTRSLLASRGVRGATIGDAPDRRTQSELRYAKSERARAKALAARLPFGVTLVEREGPLLLLVGRNAAP